MANSGNPIAVLPELVHDEILSYMTVREAINLMDSDEAVRERIENNRTFWLKRARKYSEIDPRVFHSLDDVESLSNRDLVHEVCQAEEVYCEALQNIETNHSEDDILHLTHAAETLAFDPQTHNLAVLLTNGNIEIFSTSRFGDPPLKTIYNMIHFDEILIHGDVLFLRPPINCDQFHTDVLQWRMDIPMASLSPSYHQMQRVLKRSDSYLLAPCLVANTILVYSLCPLGYNVNHMCIHVARRGRIVDCAAYDSHALVILKTQDRFIFLEFDIESGGQLLKEFLVADPATFISPSIAFPWVLVSQNALGVPYPNSSIYGARRPIPGNRHPILDESFIIATDRLADPLTSSQFLFLSNVETNDVRVVYIGEDSTIFQQLDVIQTVNDTAVVISTGLAYVFARGSTLVRRRYSEY